MPKASSEACIYVSRAAWGVPSNDEQRFEFFILSPEQSSRHVERLATLASFNADKRHHVKPRTLLDVGRPWREGSPFQHVFLDGRRRPIV
jgi:hypothetical protein